jgi:endonuclease/exonuclease/phosphatase family metal-dependent hydrolase
MHGRLYSNWDQRCPEVSKNVKFVDVVCLQEISRETIETLQKLTNYQLATAVYRSSSKSIQEFGNAILYQSEKAHLTKSFEIMHGQAGSTRSAACGIFEIGGKLVKVASVHLAGYFPKETDLEKKQLSKKSGFEELQTYVKGLENEVENVDGIVIGGDLNEDQSEAKFDLYRPGFLENSGYKFDGNFEVTEPSKSRRIDWLCLKPLSSKNAIKLTSMGIEKIQKQASDHLMTGTIVEWFN